MGLTAHKFFSDIKGKKVALMGIGVTNTDLIKMLHTHGAIVTACDKREREQIGDIANELESLGIALKLGSTYFDNLDADVLFRTPGMNWALPELQEFRQRGGVVTSEMEVFFDICPCPIIAITGSDGKTTTTTLIAKMLEQQGFTVHLGGNIGRALLPHVLEISENDFAVVELSSFQLISMRPSPKISVVTNVTPNHLDWHKDMAEYIDAKRNIFAHQNAFSKTVLGFDNDVTKSFASDIRGSVVMFSLENEVARGAYLGGDGKMYLNRGNGAEFIMDSADIRLPGRHNISNYLTAISAVYEYVSFDVIRKLAKEFGGVEHRIEFVREIGGVKYFNDSIASSPTRAIAGLKSFNNKIILIAGGYDKHIPFEPLAPEIINSVKTLILTGPTGPLIEAAVKAHADYDGTNPKIITASNIPDAVIIAHDIAVSGDVVSLSPASASFDAYVNFEARGRHFKELVNSL